MDDTKAAAPNASAKPAPVSRRAMLSGMGKAVPAVITLYSGAALARSSNLISADNSPGAEYGKYNCLDTRGLDKVPGKPVFDLGAEPMAHVQTINTQNRYYKPKSYLGVEPSTMQVEGPEMCSKGGEYIRKRDGSFKRIKVHKGMLVSATALSSFSSGIRTTEL